MRGVFLYGIQLAQSALHVEMYGRRLAAFLVRVHVIRNVLLIVRLVDVALQLLDLFKLVPTFLPSDYLTWQCGHMPDP